MQKVHGRTDASSRVAARIGSCNGYVLLRRCGGCLVFDEMSMRCVHIVCVARGLEGGGGYANAYAYAMRCDAMRVILSNLD
jgi:hypothetical protein